MTHQDQWTEDLAHSGASASIPGEPSVSPRMLFWAFRYALGRQTYAVDDVASELVRCVRLLTANDRHVIALEIAKARAGRFIGMPCDDQSWAKVEAALADREQPGTDGSKATGSEPKTVRVDPVGMVLSEVERALSEGVHPDVILAACCPRSISLSGEAVAWRHRRRNHARARWVYNEIPGAGDPGSHYEVQPLYTAPSSQGGEGGA